MAQQIRLTEHENLLFVVPDAFNWGLYEELKNLKCYYHDEDKFFFCRNTKHNRRVLQEIVDFYCEPGDHFTKGQRKMCDTIITDLNANDIEFKRAGEHLVVVNKFGLIDTKKEFKEYVLEYVRTANGVREYYKLPHVNTEIAPGGTDEETKHAPLW